MLINWNEMQRLICKFRLTGNKDDSFHITLVVGIIHSLNATTVYYFRINATPSQFFFSRSSNFAPEFFPKPPLALWPPWTLSMPPATQNVPVLYLSFFSHSHNFFAIMLFFLCNNENCVILLFKFFKNNLKCLFHQYDSDW